MVLALGGAIVFGAALLIFLGGLVFGVRPATREQVEEAASAQGLLLVLMVVGIVTMVVGKIIGGG